MSATDDTHSLEASANSQSPATRGVIRLEIERHGLAFRLTMRNLNALPVLLIGRETFCLENSLKAVPILDVAHVALGLVDGCLLGEVAPVGEVFLDQSSTENCLIYLPLSSK